MDKLELLLLIEAQNLAIKQEQARNKTERQRLESLLCKNIRQGEGLATAHIKNLCKQAIIIDAL